jgi:hypothetical protein
MRVHHCESRLGADGRVLLGVVLHAISVMTEHCHHDSVPFRKTQRLPCIAAPRRYIVEIQVVLPAANFQM